MTNCETRSARWVAIDWAIRFCCPSNEQQITRHCFPPSAHSVRTNESLSLTNAGNGRGRLWVKGAAREGVEGRGTFQARGNNAKRRATAGLIKRIVSSVWQHYANATLRACTRARRALCACTRICDGFHREERDSLVVAPQPEGRIERICVAHPTEMDKASETNRAPSEQTHEM